MTFSKEVGKLGCICAGIHPRHIGIGQRAHILDQLRIDFVRDIGQPEVRRNAGVAVGSLAVLTAVGSLVGCGIGQERIAGVQVVHAVCIIQIDQRAVVVEFIVDALNTVLQQVLRLGIGVQAALMTSIARSKFAVYALTANIAA